MNGSQSHRPMKKTDMPMEDARLKAAWDQHFAAIKVIREELEKEGGSIEINIFIRDAAKTQQTARRRAAAKKRKRY